MEVRDTVSSRYDPGQHIETSTFSPPSERLTLGRERCLCGVSHASARWQVVSRIPDQLLVPDPDGVSAVGPLRWKYTDAWTNASFVGRPDQMFLQRRGYVSRICDIAPVHHRQRPPVQPSDTPVAVAPGHANAMKQLRPGMHIRACGIDLITNGCKPVRQTIRFCLLMECGDESSSPFKYSFADGRKHSDFITNKQAKRSVDDKGISRLGPDA